ncbi:DUF1294 domain-containing protein [Diaphorobacter aerolatus]|nr:DUF1294 domain-containing protein [Diaphorobacter aerolatus]
MLAWIATWIVGIWLERLPPGLLAAAVAINLATYFVYASDKRAAEKGTWRVSERALHLLSLACGWPAAWFAQQTLRHKSSKHEFRVTYWATVIANTALLAVYVWMPEWGMR